MNLEKTRMDMTRSDRMIPWMIVGFFVVVAAVNVVFISLAISSHSGVVVDKAYQRGLAYNDVIKAAEAQDTLGWSVDVLLTVDRLQAVLTDASGQPIEDALVTARLQRPVKDSWDQKVDLAAGEGGLYSAAFDPIKGGQWTVKVDIVWKQQSYHYQDRFLIPDTQTASRSAR